ncbi:2-amino-4-hydroxy-6-hydroxymethyldihydropteridine diphosphokinase [Parendozoicomonas haliclonae]|uniref:2-amino-4-hydroxy-6-hydroxymethyldihydropteridine pyrophosphokinase n=1 Tax=Parendozoicomonas haliclonae TaxID=1960125 RepID=A0A1X7AIU9_9GAMM|nr:2-amino-4-hydroxy-6-hydroxymethyldihydropteridine diphosphokinase [Parendozoicomonas haliclonae]SMA45051.1 2-amino-4-hydroxy-6-hydroxymethyldihydropteridinepyrophosphokinase [Parendozoicomonas haliclonae]
MPQSVSVTAYISLGSNLEQPVQQVLRAVEEIAAIPNTTLTGASRLYRSAPVGPGDQDDYINGVVQVRTTLEPLALLDAFQAIELLHGRERIVRWGARTLDLDLLLYGDEKIENERLIVPHKEMHWRNFVLYPLADIAPQITLPTGQSLQKLLQTVGDEGLSAFADIKIPDAVPESISEPA